MPMEIEITFVLDDESLALIATEAGVEPHELTRIGVHDFIDNAVADKLASLSQK